MNNFKQTGDVIPFVASADLDSGDPVLIGSQLGVCSGDVASGETGQAELDGVFELPATTGETWTQGVDLYWNAGTSKLTSTAGSNKCVAFAWLPKGSDDETADVRLQPRLRGATGATGATGPTGATG